MAKRSGRGRGAPGGNGGLPYIKFGSGSTVRTEAGVDAMDHSIIDHTRCVVCGEPVAPNAVELGKGLVLCNDDLCFDEMENEKEKGNG
jgi:predicted nucleic acid-binding Zn ribbon protein